MFELILPVLNKTPVQFSGSVTEDDLSLLSHFQRAKFAEKTWQARRSDLHQYHQWCQYQKVSPTSPTPADVCLWLTHMASDNKPNRLRSSALGSEIYFGSRLTIRTIRRRLSTLKWFLSQSQNPNPANDPLVLAQLSGISRLLASKPKRASGLSAQLLPQALAFIEGENFVELRDKLILSLGFAGALRVSDLASLQIEHIQLYPSGAVLGFEQRKRRSDFSQIQILIGQEPSTCPIVLLRDYLKRLNRFNGPLFCRANRNGKPLNKALHPSSIARIIHKHGSKVATPFMTISGHSLRRGFIDSALAKGAPISEVMKISGHKDPKTLMLYLDECGLFENHAAQGLY
ncbi:MAG: tyrosine-type recombinase/integrase [Ferrimonas sp.]